MTQRKGKGAGTGKENIRSVGFDRGRDQERGQAGLAQLDPR